MLHWVIFGHNSILKCNWLVILIVSWKATFILYGLKMIASLLFTNQVNKQNIKVNWKYVWLIFKRSLIQRLFFFI